MQTCRSSRSLFAPLVAALLLLTAETLSAQAPAGVPVFAFDKAKSSIGFNVKASVAIAGKFDRWDATLTFTSPRSLDRRFGHQGSCEQCRYRKRHEGWQAEEQRLLRRRA